MQTQTERIGQNLHAERERQGLGQGDLSARAGVSRTTIQSIERGTWAATKQRPTLRKLAAALNVSIEDLLGEPTPAAQAKAFLEQEAERRGVTPEQVASDLIHGT